MSALTQRRGNNVVAASNLDLPGKAETIYDGGEACWDLSTGLVVKAFESTTLVPIGFYKGNQQAPGQPGGTVIPSGGTVSVELHREIRFRWFVNDTVNPVVAADLGQLVYLKDDQTVSLSSNYAARSIAGRVWRLDATRGVMVEPLPYAGI